MLSNNNRDPEMCISLCVYYDQAQYIVRKYEVAKCDTKHGMMLRSMAAYLLWI